MTAIRRLRLACTTLALLGLTGCKAREVNQTRHAIPKVVRAPTSCHPEVFESSALTVCSADPGKDSIRMMLKGPDNQRVPSLAKFAAIWPNKNHVVFATSGGSLDGHGNPTGYYTQGGIRLHPLDRPATAPGGVFFGEANGVWQVLPLPQFIDNVRHRPEFGLQSEPMLVTGGEINPAFAPNGAAIDQVSAVGVDNAGRALFVVSNAPISRSRLARFFRDVLNTPNALELSAGNAQLWDPATGRLDKGAAPGPLIVVEQLAPPTAGQVPPQP